MKVITAPNKIESTDLPTVFLAGGITNCPDWQEEVIQFLSEYDNGIILNPRRKDFPIDDPDAALEQITWEFNALNKCDIFSMWFSAGESVQPICMYELGRHLILKSAGRIALGVEPGYKRSQDVYIQTRLARPEVACQISSSLMEHALNILGILAEISPSRN